jgi:secreted trypsin-like serine protease
MKIFTENLLIMCVGWGKDVFGKEGMFQTILKKIEIPTVNFAECQNTLRKKRMGKRFVLDKSFMCAGGETEIDACTGDGGSPLICPFGNSTDRYYQAGIVAWGIKCGDEGVPAVYVNVAKFRSWIDSKLVLNNLTL